jgi:tetratricopeptide (TPR) repeat protein
MLLEAGLVPEAIHGMSIQVLDELVKVGALFGLSSRLLMAPRSEIESALSLLRARLAEINSELEDCATATRERYYRDGKQVTYAEGRKDAEDLRILRGQAVIIYVDGNGIEIPFLEEDSPLAAFLENSEKWEEVAYIDNAVLYALLATSKYPHSESARTRLTAILAKLGRHAAVFDELLRKHGPTSNLADRLNETIDVAGIQTDPERTLEVLEAAVALRPRDVTSRLRLADCKSLLRQFADAEGEYRHALTQSTFDKERIHALVGLGNCAADSERTNDAVEWFQQALAIDGTNAYALMNLGIALIRGGRPQEAVPHLEHALEASPSLASLWYYCSAAYYACGQLDKARERVKKAIELAPEVQLYREALAQLDRFQP